MHAVAIVRERRAPIVIDDQERAACERKLPQQLQVAHIHAALGPILQHLHTALQRRTCKRRRTRIFVDDDVDAVEIFCAPCPH